MKTEITEKDEKDIGTNGKLKRAIALYTVKNNSYHIKLIAIIVIFFYAISGQGNGISLKIWEISLTIPPISAEAMLGLGGFATYVISILNTPVQRVVNSVVQVADEKQIENDKNDTKN